MSTSGASTAVSQQQSVVSAADLASLGSSYPTVLAAPPPNAARIPVAAFVHLAGQSTDAYDFTTNRIAIQDQNGERVITFPAGHLDGNGRGFMIATGSLVGTNQAGLSGAWGMATSTAVDPPRTAGILTFTIAAGGTGYAANDSFAVDGGGGDATASVVTVGALGVVTAIALVGPGSGYDVTHNPHTTTRFIGAGVGLTVNVTAILAPVSTLEVDVLYMAPHVTY